MKRLLFITTSFENGAIPNILLDLAPVWRELGWDCWFLALEPLPEDQASVMRCRSLGFPLESLDVGPRSVFRALGRLRRAIRRIAPDLISTHLGRADIYTPWVKGRVPQVTTHHNIRAHHGRATAWGYRISDHLVAARTGVSADCNRSFVADGFLKTPHTVIFNPVSPERLPVQTGRRELLAQWGWSEPTTLLVTVARLSEQKGHRFLLEALAGLRARGRRDLRLVAAGEGPLRAELEQQVRTLGLEGSVRFLGMVSQVADLYAAADLFVLPSLWEGMGLAVVEAWLLGCPVVVSDLPAVREFVTSGETGLLVPPADPEALEAALERFLSDPEGAQKAALAGQVAARERFGPRPIAEAYDRVFRSALTARTHP